MATEMKACFPEYMETFECVTGCSNSCCVGWTIHMDKKTYMGHKSNAPKNEFIKSMLAKIKRQRNSKTDATYAVITRNNDDRCTFLDEDDRCQMYKNLGHDAMSSVCCTYPRAYHMTNNKLFVCAHLSCPEVARPALLNKEGLKLQSGKLLIHKKANFSVFNTRPTEPQHWITRYFFDILNLSIALIQNPLFDLEKKLMMLAMFVSKAEAVRSDANMTELLEKFKDDEYLGLYNESFDRVTPNSFMQLSAILSAAAKSEYTASGNDIRYTDYLSKAMGAIFKSDNDPQALSRYEVQGTVLYRQFKKNNGYIMENYIVNTMLEERFPLNSGGIYDQDDIFHSFTHWVIEYIMLRTTIIGLLLAEFDLTEDILVDLINVFSRGMVHNSERVGKYLDTLKEENLYSLAGLLLLIKI